MVTEPILRFLRRKPRVLLAFAHVSLMWVSHNRSSVMVTPRYLADVTLASVWSCSLYSVCRGVLFASDGYDVALGGVEFHFQ